MNITCPHCATKLNLPDEKIPKDRDSSFKCPKCRESVHIKAGQAGASAQGIGSSAQGIGAPAQGIGASAQGTGAPAQGADAAASHKAEVLICVADAQARSRFSEAAARCGWATESPGSPDQALKLLEYEIYPMVIMDTVFDADGRMAAHLNELDMGLRRRTCLVLIHRSAGTADAMAALHASANLLVNAGDVTGRDEAFVSDVLLSARKDHENFYRVYNDSMRAVGKA